MGKAVLAIAIALSLAACTLTPALYTVIGAGLGFGASVLDLTGDIVNKDAAEDAAKAPDPTKGN